MKLSLPVSQVIATDPPILYLYLLEQIGALPQEMMN